MCNDCAWHRDMQLHVIKFNWQVYLLHSCCTVCLWLIECKIYIYGYIYILNIYTAFFFVYLFRYFFLFFNANLADFYQHYNIDLLNDENNRYDFPRLSRGERTGRCIQNYIGTRFLPKKTLLHTLPRYYVQNGNSLV